MDIKLVAVDMDGTFLRQEAMYDEEGNLIDVKMDYDQKLFQKVFTKLKEKDGHFVVASGNQYYQLKSFFPSLDHEITYVAENGAYIIDRGKEIFSVKIEQETVDSIVHILENYDDVKICICGKQSAYVPYGDEPFRKIMNLFYHRLKEVEDFKDIDDQILKIALTVPVEKVDMILTELKTRVGHLVHPVGSGHGSIDLIVPGFNKGTALELLCKRWGLESKHCIAFGDGGNDIEMLQFVKYGYAMENASPKVKEVAYKICESNNEQGVLRTLIKLL